jgi:hypothetical protein
MNHTLKNIISVMLSLAIAFVIVTSAIQLLWNCLMPLLFNLPKATFLQITMMYVIINLFRFNWRQQYYETLKSVAEKSNKS